MMLKNRRVVIFVIGMICCSAVIIGYMFFFKTEKFPTESDVYFAVENKTGKEVYIWDGTSRKVYRQRGYSFVGCYGDAYTDGSNLYYLKYDVKGDIKGLYSATVNDGVGSEKLVTAKLVEMYRTGTDFVAYTVSDIDKNKLYMVKNDEERSIKISDTCGDSFAINESNICYYDLNECRIKIKNVDTGSMYEVDYANEPEHISAIGESGFAVVSPEGVFSIIDSSIEEIKVVKYSEPDRLEEDSQMYCKNGELYYLTENGKIRRKSVKTGHQETVVDLNNINQAKGYIDSGYIENNIFYENNIIISMTALNERGVVKDTLLMSFDYQGNLIEQIIL